MTQHTNWQASLFDRATLPAEDEFDRAVISQMRHIAAKLLLEPDHRVLLIGGDGEGGLARYLRATAGVAISSSSVARADKVGGPFDRMVVVGAVPRGTRLRRFLRQAFGLLERNSIVLIQDIAQHRAGRGGQLAVSEILPHVEAANFLIKDLEILGEDQLPCLAMTRMGEVLPNGSTDADALRKQAGFVFQLQLSPFQDAVPFTRDYIAERHGQLESKEQELGLT